MDSPRTWLGCGMLLALVVGWTACGKSPAPPSSGISQAQSRGSIEVVARLVEIPEGAIFQRDLYDYATVLGMKLSR
ncbi:MAG: hypothetical protein U1G07_05035 [Verrucomicrobiota bacterium]